MNNYQERKTWCDSSSRLMSSDRDKAMAVIGFHILMDQIDIAVEALKKIAEGKTYCESKMMQSDCQTVAEEALKKMNPSYSLPPKP